MSAPTIATGFSWSNGDTVTAARLNTAINSATLNATKTAVVFGRSSASGGVAEEIDCTAAGRALLDDATASDQRTTLGLGTLAVENTAPVAQGGTGQTTAALARVALNRGATALTDAATVTTDCSLNNVFTLTIGGNRTLGAPSNLVSGATYLWIITQDGTGSRTLAYNSVFKFPGGTAPTLSTTAGAIDILSGVTNGTHVYAQLAKGFA